MTGREKRTSTVCIFKLQNKQFWTLWTCIFVEVHFAAVRSKLTTLNDLFWSCMGNVTWLRYFVFVFFTKRWWQIHSSIIKTHFARTIILTKQEVIFRWCSRCRLFITSSHWMLCQSKVHMNGSEKGNFPNNELSFPYANQFIDREFIWN